MSMHWWQTINDCVGRWRPAVAFSNECDATAVLFLSSQWNEDPQIVPRVATGGASTAPLVSECLLIGMACRDMKWTDHKADGMEFCVYVANRVDNLHWYLSRDDFLLFGWCGLLSCLGGLLCGGILRVILSHALSAGSRFVELKTFTLIRFVIVLWSDG